MNDRPSSTALLVAAGVAFQSTHPRNKHLVPEEAGRLVRMFLSRAGSRPRSGASWWDRAIVGMREWVSVPGLTLHYVLRKQAIERLVRIAIRDGYSRLVVLGAGLDTLAYRLASEIRCTEVDHPATQRLKKSVAGETSIEFVPADLTSGLAMMHNGEPVVFLAEAVFLYLSEGEVREVLRAMRQRTEPTRLIFTFWEPRTPINFQNATFLADWYLRAHGEPGRWAIPTAAVGGFLASEGFRLREMLRDTDFGSRARGEHIAIAEAS